MPGEPSDRDLDGEAATAAVMVGVAALVNPVAGLLLSGGVAYANNRQIRRWIEVADSRLSAVGRLLDPDDVETMAIFNRLTIGAIQSSRMEKLEILADALANTRPSAGNPDLLQEVLAGIVVRYSPEHVTFLRLLEDAPGVLRGYPNKRLARATPLYEFLSETVLASHDEPTLVADQVWSDLLRDGLVRRRLRPKNTAGDLLPRHLSARGQRFLSYLRPNP